jgi:hypothetical protein
VVVAVRLPRVVDAVARPLSPQVWIPQLRLPQDVEHRQRRLPQLLRNRRGCWFTRWTGRRRYPHLPLLPLRRLRLPLEPAVDRAVEPVVDRAEQEVEGARPRRRLPRSGRKGAEIFWWPGIRSQERNAGADFPRALTRAARFPQQAIWCSRVSILSSSFIELTMATSS